MPKINIRTLNYIIILNVIKFYIEALKIEIKLQTTFEVLTRKNSFYSQHSSTSFEIVYYLQALTVHQME